MRSLKNISRTFLSDYKSIIGMVISLGCIVWTLTIFEIDQFISDIRSVHLHLFMATSITLVFSVIIRSFRWSLFFKEEEKNKIKVFKLFKNEMAGYFCNNIAPYRLGDIYRASDMAKSTKLPSSYLLGTIAAERIIDILSLVIFIFIFFAIPGFGSTFLSSFLELATINFNSLIIYLLIFFLIIIAVYFLINSNKLLDVNLFIAAFSNIRGFSKIFKIIFLSLLVWTIYLVNIMLISYSMPGISDFSIIDSMLLLVFITFSIVILPTAPGSIGTFQAAVVFLMMNSSLFNCTKPEAVSFSIILHAYSYITYSLIGGYFFITSNTGMDKIND